MPDLTPDLMTRIPLLVLNAIALVCYAAGALCFLETVVIDRARGLLR